MKVKEESGKPGLNLSILKMRIQSHHFMENRWGNNGNSEKLYFLGSKTTADGDCSHEIKRRLLLGRKAMTNLDSILKSRNITLQTKIYLLKAMVFPVVMYGCESWIIKKTESWTINAFELWFWRRLFFLMSSLLTLVPLLSAPSPPTSLYRTVLKLNQIKLLYMTFTLEKDSWVSETQVCCSL